MTERNNDRAQSRTGDESFQDGEGDTPARTFQSINAAARALGVRPEALRARCRRAAKRVGGASVANLGGGIIAFKFGSSWRIRFPRT
jgi:hypothetical protein